MRSVMSCSVTTAATALETAYNAAQPAQDSLGASVPFPSRLGAPAVGDRAAVRAGLSALISVVVSSRYG